MPNLPQEKNKAGKGVKVRARYTDGHYEMRIFKSQTSAEWMMKMEGDHLHSWEIL